MRVVVIGAGAAGLTCAVELLRLGHSVVVIEQAPEAGGRARSFYWREAACDVDNGPHLMMGCYSSFRGLLGAFGKDILFGPAGLAVHMRGPAGRSVRIPGGNGRLGGLLALARARGLSLKDRWSIARGMGRMGGLASTTYVEEWLASCRMTPDARRFFWDPLVTAALNRRPASALSSQFLTVMRRAFLDRDADGRLGATGAGLSDLYVRPALSFVEREGGSVILGEGVDCLQMQDGAVTSVRTRSGRCESADWVVSAVPPGELERLVPGLRAGPWVAHPIVSVHVLLDRPLTMPASGFAGIVGGEFHWVFQKPAADGRAVASLLASDAHDLAGRDSDGLVEAARQALASYFPGDHRILAALPLKERFATYQRISAESAAVETPRNLLMAGDWTVPEYPCTIESAALSGRRAAARVPRA